MCHILFWVLTKPRKFRKGFLGEVILAFCVKVNKKIWHRKLENTLDLWNSICKGLVYWEKFSAGKDRNVGIGWSQFVECPAHCITTLGFILKKIGNDEPFHAGWCHLQFCYFTKAFHEWDGKGNGRLWEHGDRVATGGIKPDWKSL